MQFKMKFHLAQTPEALNFWLLAVGLLIVWLSTHNWIALLGGFIASIHIEFVHAVGVDFNGILLAIVQIAKARIAPKTEAEACSAKTN